MRSLATYPPFASLLSPPVLAQDLLARGLALPAGFLGRGSPFPCLSQTYFDLDQDNTHSHGGANHFIIQVLLRAYYVPDIVLRCVWKSSEGMWELKIPTEAHGVMTKCHPPLRSI